MKFIILLIPVIVIFGIGYFIGRQRFSSESRNARASIRIDTTLTQQNEIYLSALKAIADGRGSIPEITAAAAIADAKHRTKE